MELKYPQNLYYPYELDTFKDLKVLIQLTEDVGADIESAEIENIIDDQDYLLFKKEHDKEWKFGEQASELISSLGITKDDFVKKIENYEATEVVSEIARDGIVTIRDKEIEIIVSEETLTAETSGADSIKMINAGEIVKILFEDEDGDDAILILSHFRGSLERLKNNLAK